MIRIMSCGMSAEDRRKYADELLLYYYNEIEHFYGKKLPFEFKQVSKRLNSESIVTGMKIT